MQLAQKLLTETDSTIAEIAHQIGYENPNKFSSAFRQSLGIDPDAISEDASDWIDFVCLVLVKNGLFQ